MQVEKVAVNYAEFVSISLCIPVTRYSTAKII